MVSTKMQETLKNIKRTVKRNWNLYKENRLGVAGLVIIIAFAVMAVGAPIFAQFEPSFRAPEIDTYGAVEYSTVADADIVKVFPTTPPVINAEGGSWMVYSKGSTLYFRWLREPKSITGGANQTANETTNLTMSYQVTPYDEDSTIYTVDLSAYGNIHAFDYVAQGQDENNNFIGDRKYNGLVAVAAGNNIVIIDVGKLTANTTEEKIVYSEQLDITPTWVVADILSRGDSDSAAHQITRVGIVGYRVEPWRLIAFGDNNTFYLYGFRYVTSPVEGSLNVVKQIAEYRFSSSIISEPLVFFNPYLKDHERYCYIYIPLDNYSMMAVGQSLRRTMTDKVLAEPTYHWITGYRITGLGVTASLGAIPQYVYAVGETEDGRYGLFIINPANFGTDRDVVIGESTVPGAEPVGTPKVLKGYGIFSIYFAYNKDGTGYVRYVEQKEIGGEINETQTRDYRFPMELRDVFVFHQLKDELFGWAKDGTIYKYFIAREEGEKDVVGGLLIKNPKTGAVKVMRTEYFQYIGSLDGAKYNQQLGLYQLYGLSYDRAEKKVTIFQMKGDRITPLPPGTYPSGNTYWLGTDDQGHDILSQLIWGTRIAFLIGIISAVVSVLIGTFVGLISGYYGGLTDTVIMRIVDILLVLPGLPIILILFEIFSQYNISGLQTIILVLSILGWAGIARVIRAQTLSLKARPFVDAARIAGASDGRIIVRHLFPNVLPLTFLYLSFGVTGAILAEAGLSYLGFVRADPNYISWGQILSNTRTGGGGVFIWWWLLPPGLAITLLSLGFYLVGRGFDEIVNPKLRRR